MSTRRNCEVGGVRVTVLHDGGKLRKMVERSPGALDGLVSAFAPLMQAVAAVDELYPGRGARREPSHRSDALRRFLDEVVPKGASPNVRRNLRIVIAAGLADKAQKAAQESKHKTALKRRGAHAKRSR